MAGPDLRNDRNESWQRIRVGLTGLGGILLLIGLASAMLEQLGPRQTPAPITVENGPAGAQTDTKKEPLAELGVAPGAALPVEDAQQPKK